MGHRWSVLGHRWNVLGHRWNVLGHRWNVLGHCWNVFQEGYLPYYSSGCIGRLITAYDVDIYEEHTLMVLLSEYAVYILYFSVVAFVKLIQYYLAVYMYAFDLKTTIFYESLV